MTKSPRRQDLPDIPPLIHQALLNPLLLEEEVDAGPTLHFRFTFAVLFAFRYLPPFLFVTNLQTRIR